MKKLAGLILILAVVIIGGNYATGIVVEKSLKNTIQSMNDPNTGVKAELLDYHRGWFSSEAKVKWDILIPEQPATATEPAIPAKNLDFTLPIEVTHGPVILADKSLMFGLGYAKSQVNLPTEYSAEFDKTFTPDSQKPVLDASIFINYLNRSNVNLTVPQFKAKTKEGNIAFEWKGLSSDALVTGDANQLSGNLVLDGVELNNNDKEKLNIGKAEIEYDLNKTPDTFFVGSSTINFPFIEAIKNDRTMFKLEKLYIYSDSSIDDKLFDAKGKASIEKILIEDKSYGPGNLNVSIKNLDVDAIMRLQQKSQAMDKASNQELMLMVLPELSKLLSHGPELEVAELEMTLPEGVVQGNLKLSLPKDENINPLTIMQKLVGQGRLSVPAAVFKSMLLQSNQQKNASTQNMQDAIVNQMQQTTPNTTDNPTIQTQTTTTTTPGQAETTTTGQEVQTTTTTTTETTPSASTVNAAVLASSQTDAQIAKMLQSGLIVADGDSYTIEFVLEEGMKLTINGKTFDKTMLEF